jgi:uncharacterized protein DUF1259
MRSTTRLTRRRALLAGGATLTGLALPQATAGPATAAALRHRRGRLPVDAIEQILGARGSVSAGVLSVSLDRTDIGPVKGPLGVTFPPAFEISGDLTFQPLGADLAFFNGDLALKPEFCSWWAHEGCFRVVRPVFVGFSDRRASNSVGTRFG